MGPVVDVLMKRAGWRISISDVYRPVLPSLILVFYTVPPFRLRLCQHLSLMAEW